MESGETPEHISPEPEVTETSENREIDDLPERLGFLETPELRLLREATIDAFVVGEEEQTKELRDHYQRVGEEVVDQLQGEEYTKAQIGLMVSLANLRRDSGKIDAYNDDLDDALTYASNMGYDDVVLTLEAIKTQAEKLRLPSREIANLLMSLGVEHGFDSETCEEIAQQPFEEAFQTAYGYLTQAGLNADEVLAEFTEN